MPRNAYSNGSAVIMLGVEVLKRSAWIGLLFALTAHVVANAPLALGGFSHMSPMTGFDDGWTVSELPDVTPTRFELINDDGVTVVQAQADGAAASLTRAISWDPSTQTTLSWRWRVDRVVQRSDITTKAGDDFAARLYVFFDYPLEHLSLIDRTKLRLARWMYGDRVPTAALCYVWANEEAIGSSTWNAYTDRVRMIVLRNADSGVGNWVEERRNLAEDFVTAFGQSAPKVTGLALAVDTDQTGESVTAWFGDIQHGE